MLTLFSSRSLVAEMNEKLNQTEELLSQISENSTDSKLEALSEEAQKLQRTVKDLQDQVEFMKNSDVRGEQHCIFQRLLHILLNMFNHAYFIYLCIDWPTS